MSDSSTNQALQTMFGQIQDLKHEISKLKKSNNEDQPMMAVEQISRSSASLSRILKAPQTSLDKHIKAWLNWLVHCRTSQSWFTAEPARIPFASLDLAKEYINFINYRLNDKDMLSYMPIQAFIKITNILPDLKDDDLLEFVRNISQIN
ncbi:hypothetical protein GJ496_005087 [Pomphorhynchus laevis]|nr:hypothetical protein GJ496_005087 [Pomphorhynchus laevis]